MENHVSDLRDFLSDCIKSIKKMHPNFSSNQIARKLELSTSTFSRFENKEIKKPSFSHALKIVRKACGESRVQDFIKAHYPEMHNTYEQTYPGNANLDFMPDEVQTYLCDSTSYQIMMMASSFSGVSKETVQAEFGKNGMIVLDKLISKKLLSEENHVFKLGDQSLNFEQETVKKLLLNLVDSSYDLSAFGTHTNWLSVQYESLDRDKVLPMLRDVYIRANKEIRAIFNDPNNAGNDVIWAGLAHDSLLKRRTSSTEGVLQ